MDSGVTGGNLRPSGQSGSNAIEVGTTTPIGVRKIRTLIRRLRASLFLILQLCTKHRAQVPTASEVVGGADARRTSLNGPEPKLWHVPAGDAEPSDTRPGVFSWFHSARVGPRGIVCGAGAAFGAALAGGLAVTACLRAARTRPWGRSPIALSAMRARGLPARPTRWMNDEWGSSARKVSQPMAPSASQWRVRRSTTRPTALPAATVRLFGLPLGQLHPRRAGGQPGPGERIDPPGDGDDQLEHQPARWQRGLRRRVDIWFNQAPATTSQPNGAELMIWLNHHGPVQPFGSPVGTASINGVSYREWEGAQPWGTRSPM